jgi:uncharacterized membrane protein
MDIINRVEQLEKRVAELDRQLHELRNEKAFAAPTPYGGPNPASGNRTLQPEDNPSAPAQAPSPSLWNQPIHGVSPLQTAAAQSAAPPQSSSPSQLAAQSQSSSPPQMSAPPLLSSPTQPAPPAKPPNPPTDWEYLIARVWLPRVFIIVLLVGVLWGFTAAVSAGLITEPLRCLLGVLAAGFMLWQGESQARHNRHALAQVLLGGSIAVLILSISAAHMLFGIIPLSLAFAAYLLSIAVGLWTALRHRSQSLIIIMTIAGYLVPFLLDSEHPDIWSFTAYEALFSIAILLVAHRYSYRAAFYFAFGALHVPLVIGCLIGGPDESRNAVIIAVLLQHAVLYVLSTFRRDNSKAASAIPLFFSFGLTAAWTYSLFADDSQLVYRTVIAVCALVYSATAFWLLRQKREPAVQLSIATLGWFLWLVSVLEASMLSAGTVIEGMLGLVLGITFKSRLQQVTGGLAFLYGLFSVLAHPIRHALSVETMAWLVLLASVAAFYVLVRRMPEGVGSRYKQYQNSLLWADALLFLVFLTQVTDSLTIALSDDAQHLILSAVWVVYSIAAIVCGVVIGKPKVRLAGVLFLFITLLKIIFADLPDVSAGARAILFIGLGSIGVAVSRLFYKRKS